MLMPTSQNNCTSSALLASGCGATDATCACTNPTYLNAYGPCVEAICDTADVDGLSSKTPPPPQNPTPQHTHTIPFPNLPYLPNFLFSVSSLSSPRPLHRLSIFPHSIQCRLPRRLRSSGRRTLQRLGDWRLPKLYHPRGHASRREADEWITVFERADQHVRGSVLNSDAVAAGAVPRCGGDAVGDGW